MQITPTLTNGVHGICCFDPKPGIPKESNELVWKAAWITSTIMNQDCYAQIEWWYSVKTQIHYAQEVWSCGNFCVSEKILNRIWHDIFLQDLWIDISRQPISILNRPVRSQKIHRYSTETATWLHYLQLQPSYWPVPACLLDNSSIVSSYVGLTTT